MRFSERLYSVPQGATLPWAAYWNRNARTSNTSTAVDARTQNDLHGRIIILTAANVLADPGAGQNYTQIQLELFGGDGAIPTPPWLIKFNGVAGAANIVGSLDWQGELIIPPSWFIRGNAEYNSGVAANVTTAAFFGYSVPIGTLQGI